MKITICIFATFIFSLIIPKELLSKLPTWVTAFIALMGILSGLYLVTKLRMAFDDKTLYNGEFDEVYDAKKDIVDEVRIDLLKKEYNDIYDAIKQLERERDYIVNDANVSREYKNDMWYRKNNEITELNRRQKDIMNELDTYSESAPPHDKPYGW